MDVIVSEKGVRPNQDKVAAMQSMVTDEPERGPVVLRGC